MKLKTKFSVILPGAGNWGNPGEIELDDDGVYTSDDCVWARGPFKYPALNIGTEIAIAIRDCDSTNLLSVGLLQNKIKQQIPILQDILSKTSFLFFGPSAYEKTWTKAILEYISAALKEINEAAVLLQVKKDEKDRPASAVRQTDIPIDLKPINSDASAATSTSSLIEIFSLQALEDSLSRLQQIEEADIKRKATYNM